MGRPEGRKEVFVIWIYLRKWKMEHKYLCAKNLSLIYHKILIFDVIDPNKIISIIWHFQDLCYNLRFVIQWILSQNSAMGIISCETYLENITNSLNFHYLIHLSIDFLITLAERPSLLFFYCSFMIMIERPWDERKGQRTNSSCIIFICTPPTKLSCSSNLLLSFHSSELLWSKFSFTKQ